jgi:hypothetical protein
VHAAAGSTTASTWRATAATAAGALISIVILATIVVWSYRLGVRDAAEVPVIRASTDAFKSKPDDPGGLEVAHQNRSVYELVAPSAGATQEGYAPESERLTAEDAAPAKMEAAPQPRPEAAEVVVARPAPATPAVEAVAPAQDATTTTESAAGAAGLPEAEVPAADAQTAGEPSFAPEAAPRPSRRPTRTASVAPERAEADEPRAAAAASSVQIQLGAFISEEIAAAQWTAIKSRNGDLLNGRGRVIMPVTSGGRQLYRLRAGPFDAVSGASALCRGLKARGEACIVASAR